jgi:hypothetical protein
MTDRHAGLVVVVPGLVRAMPVVVQPVLIGHVGQTGLVEQGNPGPGRVHGRAVAMPQPGRTPRNARIAARTKVAA